MVFLAIHAISYNLLCSIQRKNKKTYPSIEIRSRRSCGLRETVNRFYLKHHKLCQLFVSAQTFERKTPEVCCCNFCAWERSKQSKSITIRFNESIANATRSDISAITLAESRTGCFKLILNTYLHEGIFPLHKQIIDYPWRCHLTKEYNPSRLIWKLFQISLTYTLVHAH